MELLYVWIEDYKNIHHQGFNFSPEYRFEFEPEFRKEADGKFPKDKDGNDIIEIIGGALKNEISDKDRENGFSEKFFEPSDEVINAWKENQQKLGKIINTAAIIGENGAGKSNLLTYIYDLAFKGVYCKNIIFISKAKFQRRLKINVNEHLNENMNIYGLDKKNYSKIIHFTSEVNSKSLFHFNRSAKYANENKNRKTNLNKTILYSSFLSEDYGKVSLYENSFDLTSDALLYNAETQREYYSQQTVRNLYFISHKYNDIVLPFDLPRNMGISSYSKTNVIRHHDNKLEEQLEKIHSSISNELDVKGSDLDILLYSIKVCLIINMLYDSKFQELSKDFEFDFRNVKNNFIEEIDNFIKKRLTQKDLIYSLEKSLLNLYANDLIKIKDARVGYFSFKIENYQVVKDFIQAYTNSLQLSSYLNFSWYSLSSGQVSMLNLYSRFYFIAKEIKESSENSILILIDEGDLGFHPEWQRKYLKYLIDFLPQIYPEKKIQIILTTHSPFLASDLPKENIFFLKKGKRGDKLSDGTDAEGKCIVVDGLKSKEKTFAANIHTLLSDSFFLEGGLIGEFASGKIKDIQKFYKEVKEIEKTLIEENILDKSKDKRLIKKIEEYETKKSAYRKIQEMIGEEYLAAIIKNHLDEMETILYGIDAANDEKIDRLRKELKALEEEKGKKRK